LKAMRKEPQRRYASVEQFSDDIRRYLEGLPVIARKDIFSYRAGKFIRRNKVGVTAAAVIVALLILGVAGIARQTVLANRQRARAEKRFNEVRELAKSFMFKFHDAIQNLPGATQARQLVVSESLQYLNSLASEASDDPSLQSELATAYSRLSVIQATSTAGNLGDTQGALESERKALALRQSLVAAAPQDPELRRELSLSYQRMGQLLREVDDTENAVEHFRKALEISESLVESDPTDLLARKSLADVYHGFGQVLASKDSDAALEYYNKAISHREAYLAADPGNWQVRRNLSLVYKNTGAQIHMRRDMDGALTLYLKALAIDEADSAADPNNTEIRLSLSFSYGSIGSALADKGELRGALENYRKALDLRLEVASADAKNAFAHEAAARAYERIAGLLEKTDDSAGALENYRKVLAIHESANNLPKQAQDCANIAAVYSRLAEKKGSGRHDRFLNLHNAIQWYQKSLDLRSRSVGQISEAEARERERITQEIARCEAAIGGRKSK
jgi:eukaryotic-like serine/threonine-protein kinase